MIFRRLEQYLRELRTSVIHVMEVPLISNILYIFVLICIVIFISYLGFSIARVLPESFISIGTALLSILFGVASSVLIKQVPEKLFIQAKAKVYIAYHERDKEFVQKLSHSLKDYRFEVTWYDDSILAGDNFIHRIQELIEASDFFIFVVSSVSIKSEFIERELSLAIERNKKILPVLIENAILPEAIFSVRYADFRGDYEESLRFLVRSMDTRRSHITSKM